MDRFTFVGIGFLTLFLLLSFKASAEQGDGSGGLVGMGFSSLPGSRIEITLTFSQPIEEPLSFTTENPARIALDFPGIVNKLDRKTQNVGMGVAKSISTAEARGRTRVVVNLVQLVPYETRIEGNNVFLRLDSPGSAGVPVVKTAASAGWEIQDVDFRRGESGEGRIVISLSDPAIPVDMRQEGDKILINFRGASLPKPLRQRLDVLDFATPVTLVESTTAVGSAQVAITVKGNFDHLAYQSDNVYTVEVKALSKEKKEELKKKKMGYTGERLSLNFQNIEVRAVLQLLADFTGLNLVASDTVQGNVTLRLKNVPWDQALDIILKSKGLAMRRAGNVIMVAPTEEVAAREKLELESQKQIEELAPLRTEFFKLNFAKAQELAVVFGVKDDSKTLLTPRGTAVVDERTNTIMIKDTDEKLEEIRRLIVELDVPVRQVLIQSRVVVASSDFGKELGVRFGATKVRDKSNGVITTSGSLTGTASMAADAANNIQATGSPYPINLPNTADRLNVDLPVVGAFGKVALSVLSSDYLLDLELSAMHAEGRGEILANPRVITANQKEALIEQGVEIPYLQATSSGATSVSFKKAVLSLTVTPQITPDDRIILTLRVTKDSVGEVFFGVPSIDTREVDTQVLVSNGETVVLGGVYEQTRSHQVDKVPFFGDLPGVGHLFKQTREKDDREELLIFVTPKIIKDSLSLK